MFPIAEIFKDFRKLLLLGMIFGLFSIITLVWVRLFGTSIAPYHVFALIIFCVLPFIQGSGDALKKVFWTGSFFWLSTAVLILAILLSYARDEWAFEPFFFFKFVGFAVTSFASGVLVYLIIRERIFPFLAFIPFVSGVIFLAFISVQFSFAEIDPLEILGLAIARVDPNVIMNQLFRAAFAATNDDFEIRSNLKQTLGFGFIATIPIGYLALSYLDRSRLVLKGIVIAGLVFAVIMTIAPFGRAAWLALFLMGICLALPNLRTTTGLITFFGGLLIVLPAVLVVAADSSALTLIEARLDSDTSVNSRVNASEAHWQAIGASPIFGTGVRLEQWSHNVVIDAWSSFGLVGLVGALLSLVALLTMLGKAIVKILSAPLAQRHVHAAIAASVCPAIVRIFTAPNATIDFPVWVTLGLGIGLAADAWKQPARSQQNAQGLPARRALRTA